MRHARFLLALVAALTIGACARQQPTNYVVDPSTGQLVPVVAQTQFTQPQYAQRSYGQPANQRPAAAAGDRSLYSSSPAYAQQAYAEPAYQQPTQPQAAPSGGRGLFMRGGPIAARSSSPGYSQPDFAQPSYAQPNYAPAQGGPYVAASDAYAAVPSSSNAPYTLDSGDRLRIVVFGQDGITNGYTVDAGGNVNLPLIGSVPARGFSTTQLARTIGERLKQGYVREPHVTVEIEIYRPFFILGEVTNPGQYPYVANMTAETAIAIAGGFAPRASKSTVKLTRNAPGQQIDGDVPLTFPLRPGDTIVVKERWF